MAVPKHRTSKQKKRQRRSHHFLTAVPMVACSKCGVMRQTHRVCSKCGFFKSKMILKITPKTKK